MRRSRTLATSVCALLATVLAWPAHAGGATNAVCSFSFPAHFSPGISMTAGSGTFGSGGETGTISCVGTIGGHAVTGPGTFGFEGTFTGSSCLSHRTSGTSFFTVPTDAGPIHVSAGPFKSSGIGLSGNVEATHEEPVPLRFKGSYLMVPQQGTCATAPMTDAVVSLTGVMS
ncbi:MAG: hypothetical protein ACRDJO_07960 [Actinomycetota bacterium]